MQYHTCPPVGQSYEIRLLDNRKKEEMPELNNMTVKVRYCVLLPVLCSWGFVCGGVSCITV